MSDGRCLLKRTFCHTVSLVQIHDLKLGEYLLFSHSVVSDSATPWTAACQGFLSFTIFWSLLKLMSIESVMPSYHLIFYHPLLLPSVFPNIRVFSNDSAPQIRWPKYQSFSFNISPSNEDSGLISFGIDWFDLLEVQGTLKSLLQHNLIKNVHFLVGCAVLGHISHAQLFATP